METFHVDSECKTTCLTVVRGPVDPYSFTLFLTDQELHLTTETEQDRMRLSLLQYNAI